MLSYLSGESSPFTIGFVMYLEFLLSTMYFLGEIYVDFTDEKPHYVEWANVEEFLSALENHRLDFNHWMDVLTQSPEFENEFGKDVELEMDYLYNASIKTCEKLLRGWLKQQNCHCLVRCAVSLKAKMDVIENLNEARKVGDQHFANIFNMMLNGACTQEVA